MENRPGPTPSRRRLWFLALATAILAGGVIAVAATGLLATATDPLARNATGARPIHPLADDPSPPTTTVKLVFIHHSCGFNWLSAGNGNLGDQLGANNYYVSDTDYGWGPDGIGDLTDIGYWWTWFRSPNSPTYTQALYDTTDQYATYTRPMPDPGGENSIIMFKSCFPNSNLTGNPSEPPPPIDSNPLRGQAWDSGHHTVANAKGIYIDLLEYFSTRQDKLFVAITAPPLIDGTWADNARAFNNWLVNDWLDSYPYNNVAVWDFYNVLTSNGGSWDVNDLGWETGNHHRWWNGAVQHIQTVANNTAAYPDGGSDDHPSAAGNQKATGEYIELLNVFYHRWAGNGGGATPTATGTSPTATPTASTTPTPESTSPPPGQQVMIFQQGVHPDPSYDGTADTILSSDYPDSNRGGLNYVESFFGEGVEVRRSLVAWDISALPPDITIVAARADLYRSDGYSENDMTVAVYRVTSAWTEGTGWELEPPPPYTPDGATWNIAAPGQPWTTPGGDYDPTIIGQATLPAGMGNRWIHFDATTAVQAWVEQAQPNYGLLFRPLSGDYTYQYYDSREGSTPDLRPRLVITYTADTATPTPTPTPTSGPPPTPDHWIYLPVLPKAWGTQSPTATPTGATPTPTNTLPPGGLDVTLTVAENAGLLRTDEPVTSGVPIPLSTNLTDLSQLRLLDDGGQPVAAQFVPLARWGGAPDDTGQPVRWLLLDFQSSVSANGTATYHLVDSGGATPTYPTLDVTDGAGAVTIDTGVAQFSVSKTDGGLTGPNLTSPLIGTAVDDGGSTYATTGPVTVTVALQGPMRVSVQVQGAYRDGSGTALLDYTSRYWFYAGRPTVRLFHTVENNNLCPLDEYGQLGCYHIGSSGSITVADLSLALPTDLAAPLTYQAGGEGSPVGGNLNADLLLYQDSSGSDDWDNYAPLTWYTATINAEPRMQAYVSFRGYRTTLGAAVVDSGDRAAGWIEVSGNNGTWGVGGRDFWQNFPQALRASPDASIEIGLFPDEFGPAGYGFNLRAGEHKTHEIWLSALASSFPNALSTLFAAAPPDWYIQSGALPFLSARNYTDWPDHEYYVDYQLTTSPDYEDWMDWYPNLPTAIERSDFYGIFDYGDVPLDYEGYYVAPMNLKYNMDYGMWLQWLRGGDPRWFGLAEAAGRHIADIDILHNVHSPRHWGDGIFFGHSYHDEPGLSNPHRNEGGNHPDVAFGLPGLLTTYYLTGYEKAYQAAQELADCIEYRLHNDSHLCYFFPAGECSGEGYALEAADGLYDAGSRPAANNLLIAVNAFRATADLRYLDVADALVDWADASAQPYIGCPTIPGDERMMRPWMLNMYLRALAEYIEVRLEFGLPDTYDATGDFLAYADWLRTCPWLDLTPIDTGPRGAYPYEWWFDGRTGIPGDDNDNDDPSINNWLLLGADALAYAYHLGGDSTYLESATRLFRAGTRDPWFEGDANTYTFTKETANSIVWGHVFLQQ